MCRDAEDRSLTNKTTERLTEGLFENPRVDDPDEFTLCSVSKEARWAARFLPRYLIAVEPKLSAGFVDNPSIPIVENIFVVSIHHHHHYCLHC